jgi:hypothetical protein
MSQKQLRQANYTKDDLRKDWQAYQLSRVVLDCVRERDAKRKHHAWFSHRVIGDLTLFLAIGDPTPSGHPNYVASRVDWRGDTVLDQIYDEHRHDVLTYKPGSWVRDLRKLQKLEMRNV